MTGDFLHTPLADPRAEIRLIHVMPANGNDDEIECTISTHRLDCVPEFAAISYTWGDMSHMCKITLNGKQLSIGQNSRLVLWQVRLHKLPLPLWMDVLSIDQKNNEEKSVQVGIMGDIYTAAKFTCVSLGPHENDSEFLTEQIRTHAHHIKHSLAKARLPDLEPVVCSTCGALPTRRMYLCKSCGKGVTFCRVCKDAHNEQARHRAYLDVRTEAQLRGVCVGCEKPLSTRWYQPEDDPEGELTRICEHCAGVHLDGAYRNLWDCRYAHMNEWENMTEPQNLWNLIELQTSARFFDMPLEVHRRLNDALRLLSLRPYFTRLWVRCIHNYRDSHTNGFRSNQGDPRDQTLELYGHGVWCISLSVLEAESFHA